MSEVWLPPLDRIRCFAWHRVQAFDQHLCDVLHCQQDMRIPVNMAVSDIAKSNHCTSNVRLWSDPEDRHIALIVRRQFIYKGCAHR